MPVVFRSGGFRFFFYADEGNPREPPHIHVRRAGCEVKLWLSPDLSEARNYGFSSRELRDIRKLIEEHREQIERTWAEFFD